MGMPKGYWRRPTRAYVFCSGYCRTRIYYPGPDRPSVPQFCGDKCRRFVADLGEARARAIQERNKSPAEEVFLEQEIVRVNAKMSRELQKHQDLGDYAECAALLVALQQRIKEVRT